jgi:hypothetical protein
VSLLGRPRDDPLEGGELFLPLDQELTLDHAAQRTPWVQDVALSGLAGDGREPPRSPFQARLEPPQTHQSLEGPGVVGVRPSWSGSPGSQVGSHSLWTVVDCRGRGRTRKPVVPGHVDSRGRLRTPLGDLRIRRLGVELGEFAESPPGVLCCGRHVGFRLTRRPESDHRSLQPLNPPRDGLELTTSIVCPTRDRGRIDAGLVRTAHLLHVVSSEGPGRLAFPTARCTHRAPMAARGGCDAADTYTIHRRQVCVEHAEVAVH